MKRAPKDIPIIYSSAMVRALLREARSPGAGKTMTRRLLYSERCAKNGIIPGNATCLQGYRQPLVDPGRHGLGTYWTLSGWQNVQPGDRLWVKEAFCHHKEKISRKIIRAGALDWVHYRATDKDDFLPGMKWKPSIHMPRALSRLTLVVTGVKIERLASISDADARAEGVEIYRACWSQKESAEAYLRGSEAAAETNYGTTCQRLFYLLWTGLHGPESWRDNPWVVALSFTAHETNIDTMPKGEAA